MNAEAKAKMHDYENKFALARREEKAAKIAAYLRKIGVTAQDIRVSRGADDYEATWAQIARESQTNPASSDTRRRVAELLEEGRI